LGVLCEPTRFHGSGTLSLSPTLSRAEDITWLHHDVCGDAELGRLQRDNTIRARVLRIHLQDEIGLPPLDNSAVGHSINKTWLVNVYPRARQDSLLHEQSELSQPCLGQGCCSCSYWCWKLPSKSCLVGVRLFPGIRLRPLDCARFHCATLSGCGAKVSQSRKRRLYRVANFGHCSIKLWVKAAAAMEAWSNWNR